MNLMKELLHQIADESLSLSERTILQCQLARHYEQAGDYENARKAMGKLWQRVGEQPALDGLDDTSKAEVLLRAGALTGWIGSAKQIEGAQEIAKNLISDSIRTFASLQTRHKVAEAQTDLAVCYWREGAFDEARVVLMQAWDDFEEDDVEQKALALLRRALVERASKRLNDALRIYTEASPLFDRVSNHLLRAQFHYGLGNVLNQLRVAEDREDYTDRALIEYSAAAFHVEQIGYTPFQACLENNLGYLFCVLGKFREAHDHLDRAQMLLTRRKDDVHLAQVDETRARVMLAEGRLVEAEKTVRAAVRILEQGDEQSLLAEALTTHGIAQARLHHSEQATTTLQRAVEVAERAGDLESAGNAALVLLEELEAHLPNDDLKSYVDRARELLANSQDLSTLKRLANCTVRVLAKVHASPRFPGTMDWKNFSLRTALLEYEAHFIRLALEDTDGVVTRAAHLLGFNHHQSLLSMLNGRHEILRHRSTPIVPRRRSIIRGATNGTGNPKQRRKPRLKILYVEDDAAIAKMMRHNFELEGCNVEVCTDGIAAMEKIAGGTRYDLLLLENDIAGVSAEQLTQLARSLAHHRKTPIVVLSANENDWAMADGADAQLPKPEDANSAYETVARVLQSVKG